MTDRSSLLLAVSALTASLVACSGPSSGAAGSSSAASSGAPRSASSAPSPSASIQAPPPKPAGPKTTGEVEGRAAKKKMSFAIELPEGLKDVSDTPAIKQYRKAKDAFDAYGFMISDAPDAWIKAGLEATLTNLQKDPDFVKNKVKILDKNTTDDGWYFTHSLEEPSGKKAVSVTYMVTKGDVTLECHGEVEGALAEKADESSKAMLDVCKTLTITAP
jgi:hypothetical protein